MRILSPGLVALLVVPLANVACAGEALKLTGPTMGTYYSIVVDSPSASLADGKQLAAKIEARLTEINRQMSTWDDASEISAFNKSRSTDWQDISAEFAAVVTEAKRIYSLTDGAFDPTVSPLIDLWGFGDHRKKTVPAAAAIEVALKSTGMQHLEIRLDPPALKKHLPELQLNLSAIAKGYAVDALAELLIAEGQFSFVVDIGGENRAGQAKASGDPWKLGVESPAAESRQDRALHRIVKLTDSSIATSGDYRNFFQIDGVTYSHAIDPVSGWPVRNPPASISVIHKSCMTADAWATAMMILGVDKGIPLARANELSVMFLDVEDDNSIAEQSTGLLSSATSPDTAPVIKDKSAAAPWFPFAAAAAIFLIAVGGMAIGTILQNKSLQGSCGGLASMPGSDGKSICELCTIPKNECTNSELREQMQAAAANCDENPG